MLVSTSYETSCFLRCLLSGAPCISLCSNHHINSPFMLSDAFKAHPPYCAGVSSVYNTMSAGSVLIATQARGASATVKAGGGPSCQLNLMWRSPSWSCSVALLVTAMHGESSDLHAGGITHPKQCSGTVHMQGSYKGYSSLVCICL